MAEKVRVVQEIAKIIKEKQVGPPGPSATANSVFDKISFNKLAGVNVDEGEIAWNLDEDTLDLGQHERVLQLGQEIGYFARNGNAGLIANGTPVMATGTIGASGRLVFDYMDGTSSANAKLFLGIVTEDFDSGEDGHVTSFGKIRGIDTTGTLSFGGAETWNEGDILYIDPVNVGYLTNVAPSPPALSLAIAFVVSVHALVGTIYVRATTHDDNAVGGSGGGIEYGATLPLSPTEGQLFLHRKAATSEVLKKWDGAAWVSLFSFGVFQYIYVDWTNGTDSDENGHASGTDAYKSINYAVSKLPENSNARIIIFLSNEGHPSGTVSINKENLDLTIEGTLVEALGATTPTSTAAGSVTVTGAGWTANEFAGRFLDLSGSRYYIISSTSDTLYIRENVTLPVLEFTIQHAPNITGPLTIFARRGIINNLRAYINTFGFVCQLYADEYAGMDTCFFKSAGTFVNRAVFVQCHGTANISDSNFETALLTDSPLWLSGSGQFALSNVRAWKAVASDNGAILFRGCDLNISHSYMFRGGLQGQYGSRLYNSNTILNSIEVRSANIGLWMDVTCSRPEYDDIVFNSCVVDTQLEMLQNGAEVSVDTANFDKILSAADDTVQKALETLDELSPHLASVQVAAGSKTITEQGTVFYLTGAITGITLPSNTTDFPTGAMITIVNLHSAANTANGDGVNNLVEKGALATDLTSVDIDAAGGTAVFTRLPSGDWLVRGDYA